MTMTQFRHALSASFLALSIMTGWCTAGAAQTSADDAAIMADLFKDFDASGTAGADASNPLDLQDDYQKLIQRLKEQAMRNQQKIGEQHFKALPEETQALVEQSLSSFSVVINKLRLQGTVGSLAEAVFAQTGIAEDLKQALAKLSAALSDDTFVETFFTNISNNSDDKKQQEAAPTWGKAEVKELVGLLKNVSGDEAEALRAILAKLYGTDYRAAARLCYNANVAAIDELEAKLKKASAVLMQQLTTVPKGDIVLHDALKHWTQQVNKHLHTVVNVKKAAAKAKLDLSWLLFAVSHLYDIVDPYFMVHGQWGLRVMVNGGGTGHLVNQALMEDVCVRSGIALAGMAQHHFETAGGDITNLIIGDARNIMKFVDPLDEGVGVVAVGGLLEKIKKYSTHLFAGAKAFHSPTMFGSQMTPLVRFGIRFSCAFAWYNIGNFTALYNGKLIKNDALDKQVYRAILRLGIFELQGFVSGAMQRAIYEHVGVDRVYAIENATMGIVSPQLLSEFMDVCVTNFLMHRHPKVEQYIAKFDEGDIYGYNSRWYLLHMVDAYGADYSQSRGPGLSAYLQSNKQLYLEYSALYYMFGAVGRHWARKGAEAHIEALSAGVCKVGMKVASWLLPENEVMLLSYTREFAIFALQAMIQDVMHTAGSEQRNRLVDFMRSTRMLPADVQDDKMINHTIVNIFIDYCFSMGIFDYRQAKECIDKYKTHQDDLVEEFIPYLVDKIGHGILINLSGFIGRHIGYQVAEKIFFKKPSLVYGPYKPSEEEMKKIAPAVA